MIIRALNAADAPAYKALRDECIAAHEEAFRSDAAQVAQLDATHYTKRLGVDANGTFTLGAWLDDVLAGAITCERDARIKVRHVGHIVGMMVLPASQCRGLGRALLHAAIQQAAEDAELRQLTLGVTASNHRAVRLYESAGFVRYGSLPQAILWQGRSFDNDLMRLVLRSGVQ